jgi:hypothetical protein
MYGRTPTAHPPTAGLAPASRQRHADPHFAHGRSDAKHESRYGHGGCPGHTGHRPGPGTGLEEEDGKLIYSFEMTVAGRQGMHEVHVDAISSAYCLNMG